MFKDKFANVPQECRAWLRWTNWQTVTQVLLDVFGALGEKSPDVLFAHDLYDLLDKRRLRGFLPFGRLAGIYADPPVESVFFSAQSASFRGAFIGYAQSLATQLPVKKSPLRLFYSKSYFCHLPRVSPTTAEFLFYREAQDEH